MTLGLFISQSEQGHGRTMTNLLSRRKGMGELSYGNGSQAIANSLRYIYNIYAKDVQFYFLKETTLISTLENYLQLDRCGTFSSTL